MAENTTQRKLTAILSADVKGYSKLMGDDDESTVNTITAYRTIISELIQKHHGRVVDTPGDNILAEFNGALNAVNSGIEIQQTLAIENGKLPSNRRMDFRIGVNLGDVLHKDERIYGDGVNVAARIESLADPGGISISRSVFDQVKKRIRQGFEYMGEHEVKNISEPVRIYRVLLGQEFKGRIVGEPSTRKTKLKRPYAIAIALLLICSVGLFWYAYQKQNRITPASTDKMAFPLPDKPSIAVLPFDNMSGDPDQEYFSDGITEHIITSLSKVPYLFVIARNSSFSFKNKNVKAQQIAEELGVRYILEGSVQRSGDHVRINAQLIDATGGYHLWADSFDRKIDDIFSLQDEIAMKIMAELQVKLTIDELGRIYAIKTKNIKAYEKYLLGFEHLQRRTEGDSQQAKRLAEEAISLDPEYGAPYLLLAQTYLEDVWYYKSKPAAESLETAERLVQKAVKLSGQDSTAHQILCSVYHLRRQYDQAIEEAKKAINLSPNSAEANFFYGQALRMSGRFDEAIVAFNKAIRLNPVTPLRYINNLAWAYAFSENYEKAIALWHQSIERNPDYFFAHLGLTLAYQLSGNETKAREAAAEVLRLKPNLTISMLRKGPATKNYDRERALEAARKAGIPE
jgi:adenylate cyclase